MKFRKVNGCILFLGIFSSLVCQSASGQGNISFEKDNLVCVKEEKLIDEKNIKDQIETENKSLHGKNENDKEVEERRDELGKFFITTGICAALSCSMLYGGYKLSSYLGDKNGNSFPDVDVEKAQSDNLKEQKSVLEKEKEILLVDENQKEEKKVEDLKIENDKIEDTGNNQDLQKEINLKHDSINTKDSSPIESPKGEEDKDVTTKTEKDDSNSLKSSEKEKIDKPNKEEKTTVTKGENGSTDSDNKDGPSVFCGIYSEPFLYFISRLPIVRDSGFPEALCDFWHFRTSTDAFVNTLKSLIYIFMIFRWFINIAFIRVFYYKDEKIEAYRVMCHIFSFFSPTFSRLAAVVKAVKDGNGAKSKLLGAGKGFLLGYSLYSYLDLVNSTNDKD